MNRPYKVTFNGYALVLRSILKLIANHDLNFSKLGAYLCFVFQADWSNQPGHNYGCILRGDKEIAKELGINYSTINRARKHLIESNLLIVNDGITYITNLDMFNPMLVKIITKNRFVNSHMYFAKKPNELAETLMKIAKTQKGQPQNDRQSFKSSFKSRLSVSDENDIPF